MGERSAVIGIGQTKYDAKRVDVSIYGLIREAALRALEDADLGWKDIDAVVIGKAPDMFEGVMMPELFLAEALGGAGKPMFRVHTAGSVGGSTANVAISMITSGIHDRVLTIAWEKQSESNAMWALSQPFPFQPPVAAGALRPSGDARVASCTPSGAVTGGSGCTVNYRSLWSRLSWTNLLPYRLVT